MKDKDLNILLRQHELVVTTLERRIRDLEGEREERVGPRARFNTTLVVGLAAPIIAGIFLLVSKVIEVVTNDAPQVDQTFVTPKPAAGSTGEYAVNDPSHLNKLKDISEQTRDSVAQSDAIAAQFPQQDILVSMGLVPP